MRIRTDGEYQHRKDTIDEAAQAWGCNKTRAVLLSCELATTVLEELPRLLEDDRLPPEVAADVVDAIDESRHLEASYQRPTVDISSRS